MARIDDKSEWEYPWYVRWIFRSQKKRLGKVLEASKLWGRSPKVFLAFAFFWSMLDRKKSPIDDRLRVLINVFISEINQCTACVDLNAANFVNREGKRDQLAALQEFESSPLFSEKERAVLKYAEAATLRKVTDDLVEKLKQYYTDNEIVELTALIGFQNCSNIFNTSLGIAPQGFFK